MPVVLGTVQGVNPGNEVKVTQETFVVGQSRRTEWTLDFNRPAARQLGVFEADPSRHFPIGGGAKLSSANRGRVENHLREQAREDLIAPVSKIIDSIERYRGVGHGPSSAGQPSPPSPPRSPKGDTGGTRVPRRPKKPTGEEGAEAQPPADEPTVTRVGVFAQQNSG